MQSAFVDIGLDSDAFLYVSDFLEHLEEYDHVAPAEPKVPRPTQQQRGEVYPPTTNGGTVSAPVHAPIHTQEAPPVSREHVEPVTSAEMAEPAEFVPAITPLEGETISVVAAAQPASGENAGRPGAPVQRTQHPPFPPRNDRGRGGFGNRGDRGGRNRRPGGRPGQNRGGRDRRPPGRDLPPSKYASPTDSRPRESRPYEPPAATEFEPIILPGESLSIFKDRAPSRAAAPSAGHSSLAEEAPAAPPAARTFTDAEISAGLPGALFATPPRTHVEEHEGSAVTETHAESFAAEPEYAAASPDSNKEITHDLEGLDLEAGPAVITDAHAPNGAGLSEEDVSSLAAQLAEAKHEEAQADAEQRSEAVEAVAEAFVEPAELEELQEALDSEQDDHEDAADEADALADEMHDEALAAEAGPGQAEEHGEDPSEEHAELHGEAHDESNGEGEFE
jgi:ribonuclease G